MPTFSVIMNCLNGQRFLTEALDSVFEQTLDDWEIIFFDSGSTDKSIEIASSYGDKVKIFSIDDPVPLGQARQAAIDRATGDFLAFLDVDDVWLPFKLEVQYAAMRGGEFDISYGGIQCIDEFGNNLHKIMPIHSTGPLFEKMLSHVEGGWCNFVINRKRLIDKGVRFNPALRSSSEEDMVLSLLAYDGTGVVINAILSKYRIVRGSVTFLYSHRLASERFETLERLVREHPDIRSTFPRAFNEAEARGYYYHACFLLDTGQFDEAHFAMGKASLLDKKYRLLKFLIRFPLIWRVAHRFKGYLAPVWLKYSSALSGRNL
jgi:glycosyltransferase involved in cell wall biosynthesis